MQNDEPVHVLVIEDENDTLLLFKKLLEKDFAAKVSTAKNCASAREVLKSDGFDIVILDYQLPDGDGLQLLSEIEKKEDAPPVIIVTGHGDESIVLSSFKQGASGYVVKDPRLSTTLAAEVKNAITGAALKKAESQLRGLGEFFRIITEHTADIILITDKDGNFSYISPSIEQVLGYKPEELLGKNAFETIHPEDLPAMLEKFLSGAPGVPIRALEYRVLGKDGAWHYFDGVGTNLLDNPAVRGNVVHSREVTEQKKVERALKESNRLYKTLMDTSPDAITVTDLKGRITNVSFRTMEMYGTDDINDMIGMSVFDTISPEDIEKAKHFSKETYRQGFSRNVEYTLLRKDGTKYIVELNSTLLKDDDGSPQGFITIIRDITERKKTEADLRDREHRLRLITDNMLDIIAYVDNSGRSMYISPSAETALGYKVADYIGKEFLLILDIVHPEDKEHCRTSVENGFRTHEPQRFQFRVARSDGEYIWLDAVGNPLIGAGGNTDGMVFTLRDITRQKEAEQELLKINTQLDGYAHTVSHDLKSSVSAMLLGSETLKAILPTIEGEDARQKVFDIADTISSSANRAISLIGDILSLAEAGQVPHEISEVNVGRVVSGILDEIESYIRKKGVKVLVDEEMGTLQANPTQIYQLFSNLIANAVNHNTNPDPALEISYLGKDKEDLHRYRVKDNGPGIPPGEFEKIFLPFYRRTVGSTGIGLATVDKIIQAYDGRINVYNDNGACFEFGLRDIRKE